MSFDSGEEADLNYSGGCLALPGWRSGPWGMQVRYDMRWNTLFTRRYFNEGSEWDDWVRLATCMPPEVHELPLVNGATPEKSCVYYKTQENLVIGKLSLQASAAAYQEIPVAVLPEGFRPPQDIPFIVASCARKGVTWEGTGWGRIAPDGTIFVYQNITWGWVEAQFSFIAAS